MSITPIKTMSLIAMDWAIRAFGPDQVHNPMHRAIRTVEEAVEMAQARGVPKMTMQRIVDVVYNREPGNFIQEVGGLMLTTGVMCAACDVDMENAFLIELQRVLDKPLAHFANRNAEKDRLGLKPGDSGGFNIGD